MDPRVKPEDDEDGRVILKAKRIRKYPALEHVVLAQLR